MDPNLIVPTLLIQVLRKSNIIIAPVSDFKFRTVLFFSTYKRKYLRAPDLAKTDFELDFAMHP